MKIFTEFYKYICIFENFLLPLQPNWMQRRHTRICVRTRGRNNNSIKLKMKTQETKQMPFGSEDIGTGTSQQKYFTADEAMAFMEPRIRAMFR